MFRGITRGFALGRYSTCLETYEREQGDDISLPTVDEVIERLGGADLMVKIRADKSADERYPAAMLRLRRLIVDIPDGPLDAQSASLPRARGALEVGRPRAGAHAREPAHPALDEGTGVFARVRRRRRGRAAAPGGSPTTGPKPEEIEEARRLLYVGMTRTKDRLVLTRRGHARREADARTSVSRRDGIVPTQSATEPA